MHWNKWPYWLRGGVIGGTIALIFVGFDYSCSLGVVAGPESGWQCAPLELMTPLLPIVLISANMRFLNNLPFFPLFTAMSFAFWFVGGALIGYIVGHIKSKKKSPSL